MDDGDVRDADKAKDDAEVRAFDVIGLHGRACGVFAATGDDNGDLLTGRKALETVGSKGEGLIETDDVVNPGLKHRRHVEVIHGGRDNDFVSGQKLGDKLVR